jgi:hypothetical protein
MTRFLFLLAFTLNVSCNTAQNTQSTKKTTEDYAKTITSEALKTHLYTFAGDQMEGRMTGENGNNKAAEYLRNFYIDHGIDAPIEEKNYYQPIPASYFKGGSKEILLKMWSQ